MSTARGELLLIPNTLDFGTPAEVDLQQVLEKLAAGS